MLNPIKKRKLWLNIVYLLLVFLVLNGGRLAWLAAFEAGEAQNIKQGVLDLRSWDALDDKTITLDGEWEFYPEQFIASNPKGEELQPQYIAVPEDWSEHLDPQQPSPYGFGSYRLTLLVDPDLQHSYTLRVVSARSASKLYVNGKLLGQSGIPAERKENYHPYNIPYNGTFTSDENGKIEIIIEAANFADIRGGGLIRSLKLGSEQAVTNEVNLSNSMQQLVASVFLMHGLYAVALYFAGIRRMQLVWLFVFIVSFTALIMGGSEDKLLQLWLGMSYSFSFRLVVLSLSLMCFALYQLLYPYLLTKHKKAFYVVQVINASAFIAAMFVPFDALMLLNNGYSLVIVVVLLISFIIFLLNLKQGYSINRIYLLSVLAVCNHLLWWFIFITTGIKVMYYPFDLIVAMTGFSIMWCRHILSIYREKSILTEKLQRSIDMRDEFLANTSHELRNPLHSMVNIAQVVLERDGKLLSQRSIKDFEGIVAVGKRLSLMLDELLDVMSYKENMLRMNKSQISLDKLATGVIDLLAYMRRSEHVVVINRIDSDFPTVWGDENRLIQILYNLLHNALKYTVKGTVTISAEISGQYALIKVEDTGLGMSESILQQIFEPYEQGTDNNRPIEGGFGLGLSITKKLVELHGGEISVHSVPNQGSIFQFTLPLAPAAIEAEPAEPVEADSRNKLFIHAVDDAARRQQATEPVERAEPTSENTSTAEANLYRPKLLLVDDEPINVHVLESILEADHYEMKQASSGEEALQMLQQQEWDLVISDVMMPGMSGYELTRRIRQQYSLTELPVLLLTARSQPQDLQHAFACGANDYVRKPMDANEIRSRVRALTSVKKSLRERLLMEAAWLQAQIQPHFFFNTINSVIALSEIDLEQMKKLLEAFSSYLRDKFRYSHAKDMASIEEELNLVRTYLFIEQARYGDRLQVKWELDECAELKLPPLTIQPLVENAIRHGLMPRAEGGCVTIQIQVRAHDYRIAVTDNGIGMDDATQQAVLQEDAAVLTGVGLLNTNRRLKWHYRSGLLIESRPGFGTTIGFHIPKEQ